MPRCFGRIEQDYGVPAPIIVAIWGLETDFGAVNGDFETLRALATLAYDCRRTEKFQAELLDALRLIERGDLSPGAMRGDWAGELGQTQFMPSSYLKYAVDFGGGRDLIRSVPDALASTANYLRAYGWQRGDGWEPGEPNFAVIQQWNKADVYSRTIALFRDEARRGQLDRAAFRTNRPASRLAPAAVDLRADDRDRLLIDGRRVPGLDRREIGLARLVSGARGPAMGLEEIRRRTQGAGRGLRGFRPCHNQGWSWAGIASGRSRHAWSRASSPRGLPRSIRVRKALS